MDITAWGYRHVGSLYARAARRLSTLIFIALALGLISTEQAFAASQDIQSTGPLTDISLGDDLSCQIAYQGQRQFYSPSSAPANCGTVLSVDSASAGPQSYGLTRAAGNRFTGVSQSAPAGAGTPQDPYKVTTVVDAGSTGLRVTQVDSYVVGQEYYRSDITVANTSSSGVQAGRLYHAADCYLQGSDSGYGYADASTNAVACAQNANNDPPALIEEFAPLTAGARYSEAYYSDVWVNVENQTDLPNTCDCTTSQDNGMGLEWHFSLDAGQSQTFSMLSSFSPQGVVAPNHSITATGGHSFSGDAPLTVSGPLATFTDSVPNTTPGDYTASVDWGDHSASSPGTITSNGNSFTVTGSHSYANAGVFTITVTIAVNGNSSQGTVADSVAASDPARGPAPASKPTALTGGATGTRNSAALLTGSVNPGGLPTTVHWEYGLDPAYRGAGFSGNVYDQSTPAQSVSSSMSTQPVSAPVSALHPNTLYHVRLVASNSAGTTTGQDQTFKTTAAPAPPPPAVGRSGNFTPAGGNVFVRLNGKFVKLTQVRQLPSGTVVDALHGSLKLVAASGKKGATYTGTFGGAVFKVTQAAKGRDKGLTTLAIVEGAFRGAPSYAACKASTAGLAPRALSRRVLQSLRARASGRFRTRGRYAAGTVRGTRWTTVDRCDGTLISVQQHSVLVTDLVKHIDRLVKAGTRYLALAPKHK